MKREAFYFLINGGVATAAHFLVLFVIVESFSEINLALANMFAGTVGVTCSFLGNKYFVFKSDRGRIHHQAFRFVSVYIVVLSMHTVLFTFLTQVFKMDYRLSFIVTSSVMLVLSFLSNKYMVFK